MANHVDDIITKHGQFIQFIIDNPPWAYTTGNQEHGLPELFIYGIGHETSHFILNDVGKAMRKGDIVVEDGAYLHKMASMPLRIDAMHASQIENRMFASLAREERAGRDPSKLRAFQLVWPDPNGIYPDEPGFDIRFAQTQPLLKHEFMPDPIGQA